MSDLLSIGSSGVTAYRNALAAVADNVANAETPGYVRRSVRLGEGPNTGGSAGISFSGVRTIAVDRAWDAFQAAETRMAAADAGRTSVRQQWLETVESALDRGDRSVGTLIGNFFHAGINLAANPDDRLGRSMMLSALQDVATEVRATADALARVSDGIAGAAQMEVDAVNADLAALAEVNLALRQSEPGRSSHAALQDERDRLIDRIAAKLDVTVTIAESGAASLSMSRAGDVSLLDANQRGLVMLRPATDGRLSLSLVSNGTESPLPASSGSLAGLVQVAASTADQRANFETLVADFMADVNAWSAAGLDQSGNPGTPLLAMTAGAMTLQVTTTDPARIAAASATAENGNLLNLTGLRGNDGVEARWNERGAGAAQMLAGARSEAPAAGNRRDNSFAARDEVSGIDLDREAADLMRHQQAYNASSRIIQVARETLQSILDLF